MNMKDLSKRCRSVRKLGAQAALGLSVESLEDRAVPAIDIFLSGNDVVFKELSPGNSSSLVLSVESGTGFLKHESFWMRPGFESSVDLNADLAGVQALKVADIGTLGIWDVDSVSLQSLGHDVTLAGVGTLNVGQIGSLDPLTVSVGENSLAEVVGSKVSVVSFDSSLAFVGVYGSEGNDLVNGAGSTFGLALFGFGGDDILIGGSGNDTIDGSLGDDLLLGNAGDDQIVASFGDDWSNGGTGANTLSEFVETNAYVTDSKIDIDGFHIGNTFSFISLEGSSGDNVIDASGYTVGRMLINGGLGNNTLIGSQGADSLTAFDGKQVIDGQGGDDFIVTIAGDDSISGGDGDDFIDASVGNDVVDGGNGDDQILGGAGSDLTRGGQGNDVIFDGSFFPTFDVDTMMGGAGNDQLFGSFSDEVLNGGTGDDTIVSQFGADTINAGAGNDVVFDVGPESLFDTGSGVDELVLFGVNNLVFNSDNSFHLNGSARASSNVERFYLVGTADNDMIDVARFQSQYGLYIDGGMGNDTVAGSGRHDTIYAGDHNDLVQGNGGNDTIYGEGGNDTLLGGSGNDVINDSADDNVIDGGNGNDTLLAGSGKDQLLGGNGNDSIDGGGGADSIFGGNGNDTLRGTAATDIILGGNGIDSFLFSSDIGLPPGSDPAEILSRLIELGIAIDFLNLESLEVV